MEQRIWLVVTVFEIQIRARTDEFFRWQGCERWRIVDNKSIWLVALIARRTGYA